MRASPDVVVGLAVLSLGTLLDGSTTLASAEPQMSIGVTVGGGAADLRTVPRAVFHLGLHGDVLFFRKRDRDMAFGPYVEALTVAFDTFEAGGGVSWLVPLSEHVPFVLSAGAHARGGAGGWFPGVSTTLWGGSRSLNFDSVYGLALGFFVQGRYGFGDARQADVLAGLQIDGEVFVLPFLLLANAFR